MKNQIVKQSGSGRKAAAKQTQDGDKTGGDRQARRRAKTRAALIAAAQSVMGEKGFQKTTIADITDRADLGLGSFYNHFKTKEDIMSAAARETLEVIARDVDTRIAAIEDPAEAIATAWRMSLRSSLEQPRIGKFVTRSERGESLIEDVMSENLYRDIKKGQDAGAFKITDARTLSIAIIGGQIAIIRAVLDGTLPEKSISHTIYDNLRMLGIPDKRARELAYG